MTCPNCQQGVSPVAFVGQVTVCPSCARTLVQAGDGYRLATSEDTLALSEAQRAQLRKLRPEAWRENVRARHRAIVGARAR